MDARRRGRPRDPEADRGILEAARDLLLDVGYEKLTMAAVAERAGVAKQTLYRRWTSKSHLIAGAVLAGYLSPDVGPDGPEPTGLRDWFHRLADSLDSPQNTATVRALAAAAAEGGADEAALAERFTAPTRGRLVAMLEAARERGEVRADADLAAVADAALGLVLYRVLARLPRPDDRFDSLADVLLVGLAPSSGR
ncbi:TetR/AcrR family transcriptional regulator [Agromyces seonyuensis]|uniref:TetR family transcriptional regulator n=1 Tax=Agromyces seonyuensis TaxID=2662446 RepID=A0A6I4P299_9MICO|nr:TetR/AcrR family transcriptional regulator [Agromyces seonyuensis]MWB99732.1 TetR family transcriptional regulator [Agromyces seonyuensis]